MHAMLMILQAYRAMQFFLDNYYEKTQSDDFGSLLGSMELFHEGGTFDPALWNDWLEAVEDRKQLTISDAYDAMRNFLKIYLRYVKSEDANTLLYLMDIAEKHQSDSMMWSQWLCAIRKALSNKD